MDGELVRLTGTEWAVLDCLWEASPQTMTQLAHTLAGREGWAKGTTTTVLKRMTEKGLLTCRQGERAKWYAPAVRLSREEIDALYDVLKGLEEKEHG